MTQTTQQIQDAVHQTIAGRIVSRLEGSAVEQEHSLRQAVATVQRVRGAEVNAGTRHVETRQIPQTVITEVLRKMRQLGMIRRVRHANVTYIAHSSATKEQLLEATARHKSLGKQAYRNRKALTGDERCRRISYYQVSGEHEIGDSSQETNGYTYEGSVTDAVQAENLPNLNNEAWDAARIRSKEMTQLAQRRMEYQLARPKMARRNNQKAKTRWLTGEQGQEWIRAKRVVQEAREEEKVAFAASA